MNWVDDVSDSCSEHENVAETQHKAVVTQIRAEIQDQGTFF